ncbi:MAG: cytochrome c maturation protein CcmE [Sphingomonadales bacterium]
MAKKTLAQKRKQTRLYAILGMLGVLSLGAFLVIKAFEENILFFVTPSDLVERELTGNEQFRLGGLVEPGSYLKEKDTLKVSFVVTDGGATIPVEYEGLLPDLFREGQGVVAEGIINSEGIFIARTILAKHDENYMPAEVAEALKEKGYWQEEDGNGEN